MICWASWVGHSASGKKKREGRNKKWGAGKQAWQAGREIQLIQLFPLALLSSHGCSSQIGT